jgi:Tol biopolymer transport system component
MKRLATWVVASAAALALIPTASEAVFEGRDGQVAFTRSGDVWTASLGASRYTERRMTWNGAAAHPRWSPDGTRLAFDARGRVVVMTANGTGRRTVARNGASQPAWSPRSPQDESLVFVRSGDLWVVPAAGGRATRLVTHGPATCGFSAPSWSSDGRHIAFYRIGRDAEGTCFAGPEELRVVVLDLLTRTRRVVPFTSAATGPFDYLAEPRPEFTADGRKVQYLAKSYSCQWWVMQYDVGSGTQTVVDEGYECEGGGLMWAALPTPSAGQATVTEGWNDEGPVCLTVGPRQRCPYDGSRWFDVQPRP